MKPITVAELIEFLKTQPQDLPIAYEIYSEQALLEVNTIKIKTLGMPRPDGWVPDHRPNQPSQNYLVFPGN